MGAGWLSAFAEWVSRTRSQAQGKRFALSIKPMNKMKMQSSNLEKCHGDMHNKCRNRIQGHVRGAWELPVSDAQGETMVVAC